MERAWKLLLVLAACTASEEIRYGDIKVIDFDSGAAEKWAIGLSGLKFQYSVKLTTIKPSRIGLELFWFITNDTINYWQIAQVNVLGGNTPKCIYNESKHSLASTVSCNLDGGLLNTSVTLNTSDWSIPLIRLEVARRTRPTIFNYIDVVIENCEADSDIKFLMSDDALYKKARYKEAATVFCNNSSLVNISSLSPIDSQSSIVICNESAEWSGLSDLACWKGPKIPILNFTSMSKMTYIHNETAEFICEIIPGLPKNTSAQLCIGDNYCFTERADTFESTFNFTPIFNIIPEHNGLNVSCNASNKYLELSEVTETVRANIGPVSVQFGPYRHSFKVECVPSGDLIFNVTLHVDFLANPPCDALQLDGDDVNYTGVAGVDVSKAEDCGVTRQVFEFNVSNVGLDTLINISCTSTGSMHRLFYKNQKLSADCISGPPTAGPVVSSHYHTLGEESTQTSPSNTTGSTLTESTVVGIAVGAGVLLILCGLMGYLIWRRKQKSESFNGASQNPAFSASVPDQQISERQECSNVLYGTADDLKSGGTSGSNSKEVVDNVLYGSTAGPQLSNQVYASVNKTGKKGTNDSEQAADLYASVQKPKKSKTNGKGVDPGASTSNSQSADTYAEVDKVRKNKKDGKNAGKGKQNAGFSGDLDQDVTYAAVDKKNRKGAKDKKKSDNKPGTSGMIEEATYAQVNKPKKGGPDDEDLHGSNK